MTLHRQWSGSTHGSLTPTDPSTERTPTCSGPRGGWRRKARMERTGWSSTSLRFVLLHPSHAHSYPPPDKLKTPSSNLPTPLTLPFLPPVRPRPPHLPRQKHLPDGNEQADPRARPALRHCDGGAGGRVEGLQRLVCQAGGVPGPGE